MLELPYAKDLQSKQSKMKVLVKTRKIKKRVVNLQKTHKNKQQL